MNTPQLLLTRGKQYLDLRWIQGIVLVITLAFLSIELSKLELLQEFQISSLTIGIIMGVLVGNTVFPVIATHTSVGVDFSKSILLKVGVILFGFRITFSQLADVGWHGLITDVLMLTCTFLLAMQLGRRLFKLDLHTTILIGAGSSICGAAAIMATEPVIKAQAHKVSVAVATVVVFGTISMIVYPLCFQYLGMNEHAYGIFVGSTIHEVAQVVAAGSAISANAADSAVIEKMLRVMMLAPFLLCLSFWQSTKANQNKQTEHTTATKSAITIPWFAVLFIVASAIHSLALISTQATTLIVEIDNFLLTIAMVALGIRTHIGAIHQAGMKPLLLASCLFIFLTLGGYIINVIIPKLF